MTARRPLVQVSGTLQELPSVDSLAGDGAVPSGGTAGQTLGKVSSTNYDLTWLDVLSGTGGITKVSIVATMPTTPDSTTLYVVTG